MRDDFDGSIGRAHRVELVYRMQDPGPPTMNDMTNGIKWTTRTNRKQVPA